MEDNKIRKARKDMSLTQAEMADRLGVSLSTYKRFENRQTRTVSCHLEKMAELADMSKEEILLGSRIIGEEGGYLRSGNGFEEFRKELVREYEEKLAEKDRTIAFLLDRIDKIKGKDD